jgi:hypothetical protein
MIGDAVDPAATPGQGLVAMEVRGEAVTVLNRASGG